MKDTVPMKSSTTNSTMGETGCRMAHAEMFRMTASLPSGRWRVPVGRRGSDVDRLTIAQEPAGGRDYALRARQPLRDDDTALGRARDAHRMALDLACGVHQQDVTPVRVGHHCGLRQHRPLGLVHGHY